VQFITISLRFLFMGLRRASGALDLAVGLNPTAKSKAPLARRKTTEESDGHPQISQSCRTGKRLLPDSVFLPAGSERQASARIRAGTFATGVRHPETKLLRLSWRGEDVGAGPAGR